MKALYALPLAVVAMVTAASAADISYYLGFDITANVGSNVGGNNTLFNGLMLADTEINNDMLNAPPAFYGYEGYAWYVPGYRWHAHRLGVHFFHGHFGRGR